MPSDPRRQISTAFATPPLRPSSLLSRTLALLVLLLALLGSYRLIAAPLVAAYETTAHSIEQSRMLLERYRSLAAQREELAAQVDTREKAAGENAAYFDGKTDSVAAAAVHDHVGTVIVRAGGELHSIQVLPSESVDKVAGVRRIRLRLDLSLHVEALEGLIYDLEFGKPYLFIEQIAIQTQTSHNDHHEQRRLALALEVYGYARTPEL